MTQFLLKEKRLASTILYNVNSPVPLHIYAFGALVSWKVRKVTPISDYVVGQLEIRLVNVLFSLNRAVNFLLFYI